MGWWIDLRRMMVASAVLRVFLVAYGEWQDAHMEVRYTDVDYLVFSDAAAMVAMGRSPFERLTYRYSPLLAFLLVPNSILHPCWGKLLFSAADLLVGLFVDVILKLRGVPENLRLWSVAAWLFNPFTFTIGTRGNCEPIVCAVILWIILCVMNGPDHKQGSTQQDILYEKSRTANTSQRLNSLWLNLRSVVTWDTVLFGLFSATIFFLLTTIFFYIYGWEFLNEALLYHLTRTDPRHNFSIYFYHVYLNHELGFSVFAKLVSFLPQLMVQLALIFSFAGDLPFCLFAQTVAFVAFNKVMTAQYFVWFFCLLPLILPWSRMKIKWKGFICMSVWMASQIHWLMWAYLLEFKGRNVFIQLWLASLLFLAANTFVLIMIIRNHKYSEIFMPLARAKESCSAKLD